MVEYTPMKEGKQKQGLKPSVFVRQVAMVKQNFAFDNKLVPRTQ